VSADKPHGERIATLEAQAAQAVRDNTRVSKEIEGSVKRERVLILGIAAFLASQFFDIFRGQP
jgi:hypothetical protein